MRKLYIYNACIHTYIIHNTYIIYNHVVIWVNDMVYVHRRSDRVMPLSLWQCCRYIAVCTCDLFFRLLSAHSISSSGYWYITSSSSPANMCYMSSLLNSHSPSSPFIGHSFGSYRANSVLIDCWLCCKLFISLNLNEYITSNIYKTFLKVVKLIDWLIAAIFSKCKNITQIIFFYIVKMQWNTKI